MKVRVISGVDLSAAEHALWSRWQQEDPSIHHPFLHPAFTVAAGAVLDGIEVGVVEDGGDIVGFFPFQRVTSGIGRAVAWRLSDQHGIVRCAATQEWSAVDLLRGCRLSAWHFDHLDASQTLFQPYHHSLDDAAYMDVSAGYVDYELERRREGSSMFSDVGRKSRKMTRELGPLRFAMHTECSTAFESLIAWKRRQLHQSRFFDVFRLNGIVALLDRLRQIETDGFAGRLSALYAGDTLVAVHLGLRSRGFFSSWIPTFDQQYARYSPGAILHLELAKQAAAEGVTRIDLGRGLNQLKVRLMSGVVPLAIGCVDRRPVRRAVRKGWSRTRALVNTLPVGVESRRVLRRIRHWVARHD